MPDLSVTPAVWIWSGAVAGLVLALILMGTTRRRWRRELCRAWPAWLYSIGLITFDMASRWYNRPPEPTDPDPPPTDR